MIGSLALTEHDQQLLSYIRTEAGKDDPNPIFRMVLDLGEPEPPIPRPRGIRRTRCAFCYQAAWNALLRHPELRYIAVGFALRRDDGLYGPVGLGDGRRVEGHGWVSDGEHAIEVTWPEPAFAYYGIRFDRETYAQLLVRYQQWDVIRWLQYEVSGWWSPDTGVLRRA